MGALLFAQTSIVFIIHLHISFEKKKFKEFLKSLVLIRQNKEILLFPVSNLITVLQLFAFSPLARTALFFFNRVRSGKKKSK